MIDSHCHLTAPQFEADLDAVIARATAANVSPLITISDDMSDLEKCFQLAQKYEQIFYTVGVHPHHASSVDLDADLKKICEAAAGEKCRGIGEIGLDYHSMNSPKDVQQRVFEVQLALATALHLPAVVHCREAVRDVWTTVQRVGIKQLVIHCCTERWEDVEQFVRSGFLLSFTGILTYPKSSDIRETVRQCPLSQLMIETDAPFLAPVPYRGKRCEPAYVVDIARAVAEIKGVSVEEVDRVTTGNAVQFFGLRL